MRKEENTYLSFVSYFFCLEVFYPRFLLGLLFHTIQIFTQIYGKTFPDYSVWNSTSSVTIFLLYFISFIAHE